MSRTQLELDAAAETHTTPWVEGLTLPETLARTVARVPGRDAIVFPQLGLRWSYKEYARKVEETALAMIALGVKPGDQVAIWSTNWPEWPLAQFAAAAVGAVLINVNPSFQTAEASFLLSHGEVSLLILNNAFRSSNYEAMTAEISGTLADRPFGEPLKSRSLPALRHVVCINDGATLPGVWPWSAFLAGGKQADRGELARRTAALSPGDPVNIQYTSGTTGRPKGAMLSHRSILLNAHHMGIRQRFTESDRCCVPLPFFHCFGCVAGNILAAVYGSAVVVPSEVFDPEACLTAISSERCTAIYGVPTMFSAMIHHPRFAAYDLSSLRTGIMGGSPCPVDLMHRVIDDMHASEMTCGYGLTETSPAVSLTHTDEPVEIRCTTVGKPLSGVEVLILDPESGLEAPPGGQGEICVRGHNVMLGYFRDRDATSTVMTADGWLRTGDLGRIAETGQLQITGRIKDMIIRGGENIYPREIEEFLRTHPKVRDVQIVGAPDEHFGEQVAAWIVLHEPECVTAHDIRLFCRGKIAHYKVPHYVAFVETYPMTATGKVQKFKLREMGLERFGLRETARTGGG